MAALSTEIALRYSPNFLISITNVGDNSATAIDTTFLNAAIADTESAFEVYAGSAFDSDDSRHVMIGCDGVIAKLTQFGGQSRSQGMEMWDNFVMAVKALRQKGKPKSSSNLATTADDASQTPYFDDKKFDRYTPESAE